MIASARVFYIPVLLTMGVLINVGCSARSARVAANGLSESRYIAPRSNAYDTTEWARQMATKDRNRAERIVRLKAELLDFAKFNFFPGPDTIFRQVLHEDAWVEADRARIRRYLTRILNITRQRRAYGDSAELRADEAQAERILNYFIAFDQKQEA